MRKFATIAVLSAALLFSVSAQKASADSTVNQQKPATPPPVVVTVAPGDTLSAIADAHQTTYVRIFDDNAQIADPNVIDVGWQLQIPTPDQQLPDRYGAFTAASAPAPAPVASSVTSAVRTFRPVATAMTAPLPDDAAKAFIYSHESGNNPSATNPHGCYGLGQDCNGRVRALCGADYACQDAYFNNYASSRYGSWSGAEAFWQTHGWW